MDGAYRASIAWCCTLRIVVSSVLPPVGHRLTVSMTWRSRCPPPPRLGRNVGPHEPPCSRASDANAANKTCKQKFTRPQRHCSRRPLDRPTSVSEETHLTSRLASEQSPPVRSPGPLSPPDDSSQPSNHADGCLPRRWTTVWMPASICTPSMPF